MRRGTRTGARLALGSVGGIVFALGVFAACSGKQNSEIILAMQTDLSLPKDVDAIRIQVTQGGVDLFVRDYPVGPDGAHIPATLGVVDNPSTPGLPVRVRIIARHQSTLRILRQSVTTIPQNRTAMMRMPIQWLCWNHDLDTGEGGAEPQCDAGESCVNGGCANDTVDPNTLPSFDPTAVFGGGSANGGGVCFDTIACFSHGAMVPVDTNDCTIPAPSGGAGTNVTMVRAPGVPGICSPEACFVPIDSDPLFGWTQSGSRIVLPPAVCDRLALPSTDKLSIAGIATTTACTTKDSTIPTCGPWSSVGDDSGTFDAAPPTGFDAGQGGDATLPDGGTCDPATRWPQMLAAPIIPPNQIAGLDLLNGGKGDITIAEAETVNCTGTPAKAIDNGYSAIAWGPNGEVFVEYNPTTNIPYLIALTGGYTGTISFPFDQGAGPVTCTIGVGQISCGSFSASNWGNAAVMQALVQQIYVGYLKAFFPAATAATNCFTSGDCFENENSNGQSAFSIGLLQRFPLYVVFPLDGSVPNELYTIWSDGNLTHSGDAGATATPDAGAPFDSGPPPSDASAGGG